MNWFFIALIAPALWSISNHIDKYIVSKYFRDGGLGSVVVYGSMVALAAALLMLAFVPSVQVVGFSAALLMILAGLVYVSAILPYFYAINSGEASRVIPIFQIAPIFSYVLGRVFLHESIAGHQLLAGVVIIAGALTLSVEEADGAMNNYRVNWYALAMVTLSSFLFALNGLIFKVAAINSAFWTTAFWQYIGVALGGFLLLAHRPYYRQFRDSLVGNSRAILILVGLSEGITVIARLCFYYASLLAALALVSMVNGFQPFFILVFGTALSIFVPKFSQENLSRRHLQQKLLAILLLVAGTYLLFR